MHLGSLISRLESEEDAGAALAALGDLVLYARVLETGAQFGEEPAAYTASAVARFAARADDAEWVTLMGAMERTGEPAQAFLGHVLNWALAADGRDSASAACAGNHCSCS